MKDSLDRYFCCWQLCVYSILLFGKEQAFFRFNFEDDISFAYSLSDDFILQRDRIPENALTIYSASR